MKRVTQGLAAALSVAVVFIAAALSAQTVPLELTDEERAWIDANPIVRVHNEIDWPPFNFAVDGVPTGYSIDYMNMIAARTGLTVEYVTGPSWGEFLDMMRDGTLDVMLNIVRTPDREEYLLYTPPYADNPNTILSRWEDAYSSLADLSGRTVSIPAGFFYEEILTREFPDINLHLVRNTLESIKAVSFGQADAAVGELAVFNYLLDEHLVSDMFVSGEVTMGDPELSLLNIATRQDLPILASILRKGVASISEEEQVALRERWVPLHFETGIDTDLAVRVGFVVGIILLLIVIWNRQLRREVSRRTQAEHELEKARDKAKDAEALLRAVLDSMPGGVRYIDNEERILLFNKTYQELWGYPDDFPQIGTTVNEEYGYHWALGAFGEGDRDELVAKARASYPWVKGAESYERETEAGKVLEVRGQPADVGGFVTIYTDVTDRKKSAIEIERARDKAAAAEALFKDAIDNISDGFVLYDADDNLVICNEYFRDLYKYSENVVSKHPSWLELEVYDTERNIIEWESEGDVPRGERRWDDFQRKLTDGRWVEVRQRRTTMGGLVCIHVDITDQKKAEALIAKARDEAEQVADAKSEFVAVVSHEVRTPMNGVLGMARLLLDGELSTEQQHLAETIVRSGDALLTIVNDLLDVSKLEAGRLELEAIPFSPHDLISHVSAAITSRVAEKGLELKTELGEELPAVVIGDPHRVRQILTNLLENAIKFTDDGEIGLAATASPNGEEAARLILTVSDTGSGMTAETQEKIFVPYSQAAVSVARKYGGTGLGLTICRRLASLMGGKIDLISQVGKGTTFKVSIPVPVDTKTDVAALASYRDRFGPTLPIAAVSSRILQVEDDVTNRNVAEIALMRAGHQVTNVDNGKQALDALENEEFDIILMDRHMPIMDGIEATHRIRAMDGALASIPIVGITAGATQEELDACLKAGMNVCLTKPVNPRILVEAINRFGAGEKSEPSAQGRFLFVDDNKISRDVAERLFAKLGCECDVAGSGPEALELFKVHEYNAVFTDVTMEGMDGVELTRHLREREKGTDHHLPIFAVTGHVSSDDIRRFIDSGLDDVIIKPMTIDALAEKLHHQRSSRVPKTPAEENSGIDMDRLREILDEEDPQELNAHIAVFIAEFDERMTNLRAALESEDRRAIRDAAHAAKSDANYAAASNLASQLLELERAAPKGELSDLKESLTLIEAAYQSIVSQHGSDP